MSNSGVIYKNQRKFNGKWFDYVGFTGNRKDAMKTAQELHRQGQYVRIVKVRNGEYNLYSQTATKRR